MTCHDLCPCVVDGEGGVKVRLQFESLDNNEAKSDQPAASGVVCASGGCDEVPVGSEIEEGGGGEGVAAVIKSSDKVVRFKDDSSDAVGGGREDRASEGTGDNSREVKGESEESSIAAVSSQEEEVEGDDDIDSDNVTRNSETGSKNRELPTISVDDDHTPSTLPMVSKDDSGLVYNEVRFRSSSAGTVVRRISAESGLIPRPNERLLLEKKRRRWSLNIPNHLNNLPQVRPLGKGLTI